jgi:hypothetical protein
MLKFQAYKRPPTPPSASSSLFLLQLLTSDPRATPDDQGFPPAILEDSLGIFLPYFRQICSSTDFSLSFILKVYP